MELSWLHLYQQQDLNIQQVEKLCRYTVAVSLYVTIQTTSVLDQVRFVLLLHKAKKIAEGQLTCVWKSATGQLVGKGTELRQATGLAG